MELNEQQKQIILDNGSEITDLTELTKLAFPDKQNIDGRSKEGRAVRAFMLESGINYETKHVYPKEDLNLSAQQKEFISNSSQEGMNALQIAAVLFPEI